MTTRLVATVMVRDVETVAPLLVDPPAGVDYLELRLDALGAATPDQARAVLALPRSAPVLVTCRAPAQGGLFEGEEDQRLAVLAAAGEAGADLLDIEDTALADFPESVPGERLASCHLSRFLPRLEALGRRVAGRGARFAKLAVPADSPRHLAELLDLQDRLGPEVAVVPTGRLAEAGRVMAAARGCPLTYGALSDEHRGHPDQPLATRLHDSFHIEVLGPTTRFFAVVGRPVSHSLSPAFHNAVFRGLAMPARMVALDVEGLGDVLPHAGTLGLDGLAVTHPLKHEAMTVARAALPGARNAGAANTLVRTPAGWQARNTDWKAACDLLPRLLKAWRAHQGPAAEWLADLLDAVWRGVPAPGSRRKPQREQAPKVLLLGAGGAARAVAVALFEAEVDLAIWSRRLSHARELAGDLSETLPALAVPDPSHVPADLVVNATPVGMAGVDPGELGAFSASNFRPGAVCLDLTYGGDDSPLRRAAAEAGAAVVGGEVFFALQARRQAEVFSGQTLSKELRAAAAQACGLAF